VYKAQLNSADAYESVRVLYNASGSIFELLDTTGAGVGGVGASLAAPQVQGLIKKLTGVRGRKFQGRMFIPDMTEADVGDLGTIASGGLTKLNNIAAAWMALPTTVTSGNIVSMVLLHNDATTPTGLSLMLAEPKVATLRRRYER
jgi:hypothetical protein